MRIERRDFLKVSAAAAAGLVYSKRMHAAASTAAIRLGGPIFINSTDPAELAREHRRLGYAAAYCPDIATLSDTQLLQKIEQAYASQNVVIAEVGAWKNMLDPDAEKRRANLDYVTQRCALADALGALNCVDIAGSYNPDVWYGPNPKNLSREFFDATIENVRHILDHVKPTRTKFTVEMMGWNLPDGPDGYVELIRAVDRKAFGVHLDVCNGINSPQRYYHNADFIRECFSKLGPWIVSCHAKDLRWDVEMNVHFEEVVPGRGQVDYTTYLTELSKLGREVPLMLEHLKTAEEYDEGRHYIQTVGSAAGLKFA
ncbi:sugar phosphate isomerase/epimerase family protein [Occallatibacter riparius]|uniref:TIM barrel protein n=1 Tax=Occallatibacter riparius TaxID=1002689 RepID=A0A9J7BPF9_9BACT|nr:sugar phosphate isomerase/epimerase [Occallatibacter riparius]UWZ83021.1 TIM barrel protein [Occallatibacter riparius]